MKNQLMLILMIVSLAGCATAGQLQKIRQDYINENPNLSEDFKNSILNQKVLIGMTKEQVKIAIGYGPNDVTRTVTPNDIFEQWVYGGCWQYGCNFRYFYFENGILTSWQD